MSQALASASRLKAEIRLAQAVADFEADLSDDQKASFRTLRTQSCDEPPSINDVMRLTAEIDQRMPREVHGGSLGARMTNFLQCVQKFAALGDIIVGGSQHVVACGVWSLVRLSQLVCNPSLSTMSRY